MQTKKRIRYSSKEDPRYLRLLATSRAWKERNKHKPWYKKRKYQQDIRLYLRSRDKEEFKNKRLEIKRRYLKNPKIAERQRKRIYEHRARHPEKVSAYGAVNYALRVGKLIRPRRCQECGKVPKLRSDGRSGLQAHHKDYGKPLQVKWLCSYCHGKLSRKH